MGMSKIKDGGSAFPITYWVGGINGPVPSDQSNGMSIRDYYAAHALQALISKLPLYDREGVIGTPVEDPSEIAALQEAIAESAFGYADAMIRVSEAQHNSCQSNTMAGTRHG